MINNRYTLEISEADIKNSKIRFTPCGRNFFPADAFGGPSQDQAGKPLTFVINGFDRKIKTDLPTDRNGNPRWFPRNRHWLKDYFLQNKIKAGDKLIIHKSSPRTYLIQPVPKPRFIDLFAGIGGIRTAFERAGCRCVFSSEWDKFAQQTYKANYDELPFGDITKIDASDIPDHDILTAGFPCQPFSIAGVSKKNALGHKHGFADETQGTLFFDICRILKEKQPKAFILENVRNLKSHDKGKTFKVIRNSLEELGYHVTDKTINGQLVVPQNRERIYIVGFRKNAKFKFPTDEEIIKYRQASVVGEILDKDVSERYTLTDHLWNYLQKYKEKHRKAGNGFGFGLVGEKDTTRTLSARYYKDGSEILIKQKGRNPRRLTPHECARLMGFDKPGESDFKIQVSDTQAYRQFGNSVVVPIVLAIAKKLVATLYKEDVALENIPKKAVLC